MLKATTEKQRREVYADVRKFINPGFLSDTICLGDFTFSVRSFFPSDRNLLEHLYKHFRSTSWRVVYISASVWMVNGLPLFTYGRSVYRYLIQALNRLSVSQINLIFYQVLGLNYRYYNSLDYIEAFLYEHESTELYENTLGSIPCSDEIIGIEGVSKLGMTLHQSIWFKWNQSETQRLKNDYLWSLSKIVISPHAPKMYKSMDAQDKTRAKDLNAKRSSVRDQAYYRFKGVLDSKNNLKGTQKKANSVVHGVSMARSVEELQDEMRRWLEGEEDFHDKIVNQFKQEMKEGYRLKAQERQRALEQARLEIAEREALTGQKAPPIVGYTLDQLSEEYGSKLQNSTTRVQPTSYKFQHIHDHFLAREPTPDGLSVNKTPQEDDSERPDINELIANRQFTM